jgi:hypothetical protein
MNEAMRWLIRRLLLVRYIMVPSIVSMTKE